VKDTDIIDSHPGNIALAGRPDSLKNSPVGNFKYAGAPSPLYSETLSEPDTPAPPPPPPPPPPPYTNGFSVSFDGTNDYCLFTEEDLSSGGLTFSAWVNFSDITGTQRPIIADDGNLSNWFFRPSTGYFYTRDLANNQSYSGPWSGTPETDTWYHMMLIDDGLGNNNNSVKTYIDGVLVGPLIGISGIDGFKFDTIARSGGRYFPGKIDEVAIWQNDQTANIAAIYNSGVPGDLSGYNPLHWYRMGDNDGDTVTTITDQGSGGNDGTLTNGPTFSTDLPGGGASFSNSHAVSFDGTDDYAALSSNITLSGSKSITFWAYIDTFSGGQKGFAGRNASHYTILFNHHTSILVRFGATPVAYTVSSISTGAWNHWAFTGDGTDFKLYKNGSLEDSGTDYGDVIITMIGAVASGTAHFSGKLDEIGLFASTLSASDVSSIYNSGVPADLSSLSPVHWWRMGDNDDRTGTTITDQGSGGSNLTLTNGPTFSTDVPS